MNLQTNKPPDGNTSVKLYLITIIILWKSICDSINNNNNNNNIDKIEEDTSKTKITITDEEYKTKFATKRREDIKKFKSLDVFKNEKDEYLKKQNETIFNNYTLNETDINTNLNKIKENVSKYAQIVKENNKTKENKKFELKKKIVELKKKYTDSYTDYIKLREDYDRTKNYEPKPDMSDKYNRDKEEIEKKRITLSSDIEKLENENKIIKEEIKEKNTERSSATDAYLNKLTEEMNERIQKKEDIEKQIQKKNTELENISKELQELEQTYNKEKVNINKKKLEENKNKIVPKYYDKIEDIDETMTKEQFDNTSPKAGNLKNMYDAWKREEIILKEIRGDYDNIFYNQNIFINNFDTDYKNYFEKLDYYIYDFGSNPEEFNLIFKLEQTNNKELTEDDKENIEKLIEKIGEKQSDSLKDTGYDMYKNNDLKKILGEIKVIVDKKLKKQKENDEKLNNILEELNTIFSKNLDKKIENLLMNRLRLIKLIEIDRCNELIKNKKIKTELNEKKLKKTEIDNNKKLTLIKNLNQKLFKNFPKSQRHELFKIFFIQYQYLYEKNCFKENDSKDSKDSEKPQTNTFDKLETDDAYKELIKEIGEDIRENNINILKTVSKKNLPKVFKNILQSYFTKNSENEKKKDMQIIFDEREGQDVAENMLNILELFYSLPNIEDQKIKNTFYVKINGTEESNIISNFLNKYGMEKIPETQELKDLKDLVKAQKDLEGERQKLENDISEEENKTQGSTIKEKYNKIKSDIENNKKKIEDIEKKIIESSSIEFKIDKHQLSKNIEQAYNDSVGLNEKNENMLLKYLTKRKEHNKYRMESQGYYEGLKILNSMTPDDERTKKIDRMELESLSSNRKIVGIKKSMNEFKKKYIDSTKKTDKLKNIYYVAQGKTKEADDVLKKTQEIENKLKEGEDQEFGDIDELLQKSREEVQEYETKRKEIEKKQREEEELKQGAILSQEVKAETEEQVNLDMSSEDDLPGGMYKNNVFLFRKIFELVHINYDPFEELESQKSVEYKLEWDKIGPQKSQKDTAKVFDINTSIIEIFGSLEKIIDIIPVDLKKIYLKSIIPSNSSRNPIEFLNPTFKIMTLITRNKIEEIWEEIWEENNDLEKKNFKEKCEKLWTKIKESLGKDFKYYEILKLSRYSEITGDLETDTDSIAGGSLLEDSIKSSPDNLAGTGLPQAEREQVAIKKSSDNFANANKKADIEFIFPLALFYIISFITFHLNGEDLDLRAKINSPVYKFNNYCFKGDAESIYNDLTGLDKITKNDDFVKKSITILLLLFYLIQKNKLVSKNNTKTLDKVISTKIMLAYLRNVITNSYEYKNIENINIQQSLLLKDTNTELEQIIKTINAFKNEITDENKKSEENNYFNKISGSLTSSELIETETKFLETIISTTISDVVLNKFKNNILATNSGLSLVFPWALGEVNINNIELNRNNIENQQILMTNLSKSLIESNFELLEKEETELYEKYIKSEIYQATKRKDPLKDTTFNKYLKKYKTLLSSFKRELYLTSTNNIISSIFILRHKYIKKYINKKGTVTFWNEISVADSGNNNKNLEIITRLRTLPHTEDNKLHNQLLFWTQNVSGNATPKMFALKDVFNTQFVEDYKIFSPSLTITDYSNNEWKNVTEDDHHYKPVLDKIVNKLEKGNVTLFAYGPSGAGKTVYLYKNEEGEFGGLLKYLLDKVPEVNNITITTFIPEYDTEQNIKFEPNTKSNIQRDEIFDILKNARKERMTTNNNNSSRDHMCITMDIKIGVEQKQLVIGDFAGREGIIKYSSFRNKIINLLTNEETEQEPAKKSLDIIYREGEKKETIHDLKIDDMIKKAKLLIEKNYYDDIIKNLPEILTKLENVKNELINNWYYRYFTMTSAKTTDILEKYKVDFKTSKNILEELIDLIDSKKIEAKNNVNEEITAADYIRFLFDTTIKYLKNLKSTVSVEGEGSEEEEDLIEKIKSELSKKNIESASGEKAYEKYEKGLDSAEDKIEYIKENREKDELNKNYQNDALREQEEIAQQLYNELKIIQLWLDRLYEGYIINESLDLITEKVNEESDSNNPYIQSEADYDMDLFKIFESNTKKKEIPQWSKTFLKTLQLNESDADTTEILLLLVLNLGNNDNTSLNKQYIDLKDYHTFNLLYNIKGLSKNAEKIILLLLFYFHNEFSVYNENDITLTKFLKNKANDIYKKLGLNKKDLELDDLKKDLYTVVKNKINENQSTFFGILDYVYNKLYYKTDFSKSIPYDSFFKNDNIIQNSLNYVNPGGFGAGVIGTSEEPNEIYKLHKERQEKRYNDMIKFYKLENIDVEGKKRINCDDMLDCEDKKNNIQDLLSSISLNHPNRIDLEGRLTALIGLMENKEQSQATKGGKKINKKKELEKLRNKYFKLKQK